MADITWDDEAQTDPNMAGSVTVPKPSVGSILLKNLAATPGRMASSIGGDVAAGAKTVAQTAQRAVTGQAELPDMSTVLPLVTSGPGSTALKRIGLMAAGAMFDDPSTDLETNLYHAVKGAVPASLGEFAGGVTNLVNRIGAKRVAAKLATMDAAKIGDWAGTVNPGFAGRRTPEELRALAVMGRNEAMPEGLRALKTQQDAAYDRVGNIIQNAPPPGYPSPTSPGDKVPGLVPTGMAGRPSDRFVTSPLDPSKYIPFQTARKELGQLYTKAYNAPVGVAPGEMKTVQAQAAQTYDEALGAISKDLNRIDPTGTATKLWDEARTQWKQGKQALDVIKQGFKSQVPNEIGFDNSRIQAYLNDAKKGGIARTRLGEDLWHPLESAAFGGAGVGTKDVLRSSVVPRVSERLPGGAFVSERAAIATPTGNRLSLSTPARVGLDVGADQSLKALGRGLNTPYETQQ